MESKTKQKDYPVHPGWTDRYPAIDGISKPERNLRERGDGGGMFYDPAEDPIRSDIEKILDFPEEEFLRWLSERREVTSGLLKGYELFASIPHLGYAFENSKFDMSASTHIRDHLGVLRAGLEYLDRIEELYREIHSQ